MKSTSKCPYYIETEPVFTTYLINSTGNVERVVKFLNDPTDEFPRKVVCCNTTGLVSIVDYDSDKVQMFAVKPDAKDVVPHNDLADVIECITPETEAFLYFMIDDLHEWGITKVRNDSVFDGEPTFIDVDTFCHRAYDYCQGDDIDPHWAYTEEIVNEFFKKEESATEPLSNVEHKDESSKIIQSKYVKMGFPSNAFGEIPIEKHRDIVEALHSQLSQYMTCSLEDFCYLMLPEATTSANSQPYIHWNTGTMQFMRAVFKELYPKKVLSDKSKKNCYKFLNKDKYLPIDLTKNLDKISDDDIKEAKKIVYTCKKSIGLENS